MMGVWKAHQNIEQDHLRDSVRLKMCSDHGLLLCFCGIIMYAWFYCNLNNFHTKLTFFFNMPWVIFQIWGSRGCIYDEYCVLRHNAVKSYDNWHSIVKCHMFTTCFMLSFCFAYSSTQSIKATCSSETLVGFQRTT